MTDPYDYAGHSPFSDPGPYAFRLAELGPGVEVAATVARNMIMHYRASPSEVPAERRHEIDSRWMAVTLATDQQRHDTPLTKPRDEAEKVAGCCRDHALLTVAVLRQQGIPARTRVGFIEYFAPGFHGDHVVVEHWNGARWQRMDPELEEESSWEFDHRDMPAGLGSPFETAAEVWLAYRAGDVDPDNYGVGPGLPIGGPPFIRDYVIIELAHRQRQELLLWDNWGAMGPELGDDLGLIDDVAGLLVAADGGDDQAEVELARLFAEDSRLHPGEDVLQLSPYGERPRRVPLEQGIALDNMRA